jgi:hypothetical protein
VPADVRWFWSITVYVDPQLGINTNDRAPSLAGAKAQQAELGSRVREASKKQQL